MHPVFQGAQPLGFDFTIDFKLDYFNHFFLTIISKTVVVSSFKFGRPTTVAHPRDLFFTRLIIDSSHHSSSKGTINYFSIFIDSVRYAEKKYYLYVCLYYNIAKGQKYNNFANREKGCNTLTYIYYYIPGNLPILLSFTRFQIGSPDRVVPERNPLSCNNNTSRGLL